jgi:hypothetical protein
MREVARVYEKEVIDTANGASSPSTKGQTDPVAQGLAAVAFALLEVAQAIRDAARTDER